MRPGAVRIAVLLAMLHAVLGGALVYADRSVGLPWPQAATPQRSPWLEREKKLFREVLAAHKYDALVLPVQADEPSFDRVARSLMTRYLTLRAEERTGERHPDPTLLGRALGARERQVPLDDALALAAKLGARSVVAASARRTGETYTVRAALWLREGGAWREQRTAALEKLAYGDRSPPSLAFRDAVDALLDGLGVGTATPHRTPPAGDAGNLRLDNLLQVARANEATPAERALRLQILASLHERESLEAETLFERSLVALWRSPTDSELQRVLEARAYMHLYRRPYALERLGTPSSPAGRALAAALDGHLPDLEAAAAAIENRGERLLAEIELADLYYFYGLQQRLHERRSLLLEPAWTHATLLGFRLSQTDSFGDDVHKALAEEIGKIVPVHPAWWGSETLATHDLELARSLEAAYAPVWRAKGEWAARRAADRPAEWDYYDLLFAANRQAMLKTVHATLHQQGQPAQADAMADALAGVFDGYPRLMYLQAWALDRLGRDALPGAQQRLLSRSSALAAGAYRFEGGESHLAAAVEGYIHERDYRKYLDEPPRHYRRGLGSGDVDREIAFARRRLAFTDHSAEPLRDLVRWLRRAGRPDEALDVLEENRHRFVGAVTRAELLAEGSPRPALP